MSPSRSFFYTALKNSASIKSGAIICTGLYISDFDECESSSSRNPLTTILVSGMTAIAHLPDDVGAVESSSRRHCANFIAPLGGRLSHGERRRGFLRISRTQRRNSGDAQDGMGFAGGGFKLGNSPLAFFIKRIISHSAGGFHRPQKIGRRDWIRTNDLYHVKVAL